MIVLQFVRLKCCRKDISYVDRSCFLTCGSVDCLGIYIYISKKGVSHFQFVFRWWQQISLNLILFTIT